MDSNNLSHESSDSAVLTIPPTGLWTAVCEVSIKRRIVERTGGRIQSLRIETIGSRLVIRGSAPSYYLKQLALHGVRDVVGFTAVNEIEFNVEVSGSS